jgi:rare lipoprotein A
MAEIGGGRAQNLAPVGLLVLMLVGCASQPYGGSSGVPGDGLGSYRVGGPYEINGVWYYPAVDYHYDRTGIASWYGREFAGRYTANGEVFDPNRLTAANTTLPMPTIVEVTNLQNGRSLRLRINDRGPFLDGRLIDVSRRAAQLLGFEVRGTTPVEVKVLKNESIVAAEQAMGDHGQILVADAADEPKAAVAPAPGEYTVAASHSRAPLETTAGSSAARMPPHQVGPPLPRLQQMAMTPAARAAQELAPTRSARSEANLSQLFSLIASAEAAPLPRAARGTVGRKSAREPAHIVELPRLRPRVAPVAAGPRERLYVQAGAFLLRANARRVEVWMARLGSVQVTAVAINGKDVYRVRVGPVETRAEADRLLQRVVDNGCRGARIVAD